MTSTAHARRLELVPVGGVPRGLLDWLGAALARRLHLEAHSGEPLEPRATWRTHDGSLLSPDVVDALIHRLDARGADHAREWVLAVAEAPLHAPDVGGVFGEATVGGCCAVVSVTSLRQGKPVPPNVLRRRLLSAAVHELGHVAGLEHCTDPGCVMYPSADIADTDRKGARPCSQCRRALSGALAALKP